MCRIAVDWNNDPSKRGFGYGWDSAGKDKQKFKDACTSYGKSDKRTESWVPSQGRWPANLILQHLDGCVQDGVKKVKVIGATAHQKDHKTHSWVAEGTQTHEHAGFRGPDGTETVATWTCAEGCPVAALDAQSGVLKSPSSYVRGSTGVNQSVYGSGVGQVVGTTSLNFGDTGGASRFFKQVGGMVTLSGGGRGRTG